MNPEPSLNAEVVPRRKPIVRELCFVVLLLTSVGLAILYHIPGEQTPWGEYLTVWPPVVWLALLVPLLVITVEPGRLKRNLAAIGGIAGFLLVTEEWKSLLRPVWNFRSSMPPHALELVTWNIDSASGGKAAVLEQCAGADICLFQETPDGMASFQVADLTREWSGATWLDAGDCGILSKFPLRELPTRQVGPWSPPQVVEIRLPDNRAIVVVNVRLMLPSLTLNPFSGYERLVKDNRSRADQFQELAMLLDEIQAQTTAPIVLGGDFNTRAGSKLLEPLEKAGFHDFWKHAGLGWGRTMIRDFPVARIDQLWGNGGSRAWEVRAEKGRISDHRLVRARITLGEK